MAVSHIKSNIVPDWTGTVTVGNSSGGTQTVAATDLVRPVDWNSAHNQFYTLTGNTTGNSTASGTNVLFAGSGGISIGGSTGTIIISSPVLGLYRNSGQVTAAATAQGNSLVSIQPIMIPYHLAASEFETPMSINVATTTNNSSAYIDVTVSGVLYSRNVSTLSSILSFSTGRTQTWSSNATGTVTGVKEIEATFPQTTLTPGEYFLAVHVSTTNTATGGAATTALGNTVNMILAYSIGSAANLAAQWNAQTANSFGLVGGLGILSTGATRATLAFSDYTMTGTRGFLAPVYFEMRSASWQ
jgi:hypothetical protein